MFFGTLASYIKFPNNGGLDTRFSVTLMCWVQPGGQGGPLFSYGGYNDGVLIGIDGYKFFNVIINRRGGLTSKTKISTAEVLTTGVWAHVAATCNSVFGNISLYINGHLSISRNIPAVYHIPAEGDKVLMGVTGINDPYFKGKIAELKVYDVALNEAEIQTAIRKGIYKKDTSKNNRLIPEISDSLSFVFGDSFTKTQTPRKLDNSCKRQKKPF